jgi:hypothetical protein
MDFMRGMGSATGQKVMQSRPVQAIKRNVNDVVQAGRTASQIGDLTKAVTQLAQLLKQRQQLKAKLQMQNVAQQPQQQQAPQQQQQAPQQQKPAGVPAKATPAAFRTTDKPKGRMGQHGFEYTFNSFMQDVYGGEQLNEGVFDYVKGAGAAAGGKIADKLQQTFGSRGGWLTSAVNAGKDIMAAGRAASAAGDLKKAQAQFQEVDAQSRALMKQIVDSLRQMGEAAPQAVSQIVRGLPQQDQQVIARLILNNLNKGQRQ